MTDPRKLRGDLVSVAKQIGIDDPESVAEIFAHWDEIAGPKFSANLQPISLRRGVLELAAESPAWAAEVRWLGPKVAEAINRRLGRNAVEEVVGKVRAPLSKKRAPKSRKNRVLPGKIARRRNP